MNLTWAAVTLFNVAKPFNVLVYEQVFKKRSHGLEVTKTLTESELSDFIADKELVK